MTAGVTTWGGILVSLTTPDRTGQPGDVVLGYDSLAGYLADAHYLGAIVGRSANRIAKGRFTIGGTTCQLATNSGPNHLHGGTRGFNRVLWTAEPLHRDRGAAVRLHYTSPDGEEGYPGTLQATVTYTLTDANALVIDYEATTNRATPVNLTQHSYFNLAGRGDILGHELTIAAEDFTPVDSTMIPTGEIRPVAGTPFDFRTPHPVGERIGADDPQLGFGSGYDHNFVLARVGGGLALAARLVDPASGRVLEVHTTAPGVQLYTGNFLDDSIIGKGGARYGRHAGLCLETQHFPDAPNQPGFPSTILEPGRTWRSRTVWRFGVLPAS